MVDVKINNVQAIIWDEVKIFLRYTVSPSCLQMNLYNFFLIRYLFVPELNSLINAQYSILWYKNIVGHHGLSMPVFWVLSDPQNAPLQPPII